MFHRILKAMAPGAIDLVFKSMKPVQLAEAPWVFDPARDQAGSTNPAAESAGKDGWIRLYKVTARHGEWLGMCPYLMAFEHAHERISIRMSDLHWQIPAFQPYKDEYDAWHNSAAENAEQTRIKARQDLQEREIQQAADLARDEQERIETGPDEYFGFDGEKLIPFGRHASLDDAQQTWLQQLNENPVGDVILCCQSRTKWLRVLQQLHSTLNPPPDTHTTNTPPF